MKTEKPSLSKTLTESYPVLWMSQVHRLLLPLLIAAGFEVMLGCLLPVSINPRIVYAIQLAAFLINVFYWILLQKSYFEVTIAFGQTKRLFIINLFGGILCSVLLFATALTIQFRAKEQLTRQKLEDALNVMRVSHLNEQDIKLLKAAVLFPALRSNVHMVELYTDNNFSKNPFIVSDWRIGGDITSIANNQKIYSFGYWADTPTLPKSVILALIDSAATLRIPDSLLKYSSAGILSGIVNFEAMRLIDSVSDHKHVTWSSAGLLESFSDKEIDDFDKLRNLGSMVSRRYEIGEPDYDAHEGEFEFISRKMGYLLDNSAIFSAEGYSTLYSLTFMILILLYFPAISMVALLCENYKINIKYINIPTWVISLLSHVVFFIVFYLLFLLGLFLVLALDSPTGNIVILLILIGGILLFVYKSKPTRRLNRSLVRIIMIQQAHFICLDGCLIIAYLISLSFSGNKNIVLSIALVVLLTITLPFINFFFFKKYHKRRFLPM